MEEQQRKVFSTYVTPEEKEWLETAAEKEGRSVSSFLRYYGLQRAYDVLREDKCEEKQVSESSK